MSNIIKVLLTTFILTITSMAHAKTVRYELNIENRPVNLSGNKEVDFSLMVNGAIPAPTL